MIASNYVKNIEVMQFQRELWSKSKRDTILMRIAGLVMRGEPVPSWWRDAKKKAKAVSDAVRACCRDWISEAAEADRASKPCTGFAGHVRQWNASRAAEKLASAQAVVRRYGPAFRYRK